MPAGRRRPKKTGAPHPAQARVSGSRDAPRCIQWTRLAAPCVGAERLASIPSRAFITARAIASGRVSPLPVERRSREPGNTIQNVQNQTPSICSMVHGMSCSSSRRRSRFAAFSLVEYGGVRFFASPFSFRSIRRSRTVPAASRFMVGLQGYDDPGRLRYVFVLL